MITKSDLQTDVLHSENHSKLSDEEIAKALHATTSITLMQSRKGSAKNQQSGQ
jgi:hypothetical protein